MSQLWLCCGLNIFKLSLFLTCLKNLISPMHPSKNNDVLNWQRWSQRTSTRASLTVTLIFPYGPAGPPHFSLSGIDKSFKSLKLNILELSTTFKKWCGFFLWHVFYSQFFSLHFYQFLSLCFSRLTSGLLLQLSSLVPTIPGTTLPAVILDTVAKCIFLKCYFDYVISHLPTLLSKLERIIYRIARVLLSFCQYSHSI